MENGAMRLRLGAMLSVFGLGVLLYLLFYSVEVREVEQFTSPVTSRHQRGEGEQGEVEPLPFFVNVNQLNCSKFFPPAHSNANEEGAPPFKIDQKYLDAYTKRNRLTLKDPIGEGEIITDCPSIRRRRNFNVVKANVDFPLAYIRTVFTGYLFLEEMLSAEYSPSNTYCYSLDAKADSLFKERIHNLSNCFPNVFVAGREYAVYSNGKNVSRSHYACLEELMKRRESGDEWKYVFFLQNHDIPLKTNAEKVSILRLFNGANDIATNRIMPISMDKKQNWTFASLKLYRSESRNAQVSHNQNGSLRSIYLTKSLNLITLSRAAAKFVVEELDISLFIDRLEKSRYGMDEDLYSTLNSNLPDFPGGFTTRCLRRGRAVNNVGRYVLWRRDARCVSKKFRHEVCVFGVEDLSHLSSTHLLQFYFNKMMPTFDYGAIHCWLEYLRGREQKEGKVNERFYSNLPYVRFNREREGFECP